VISIHQNSHIVLKKKPQVSIVVPGCNEEGNIHQLYVELMKVLSALNMSWEIIFSDDGSTDRTWQEVVALYRNDARVKGVRLSKNFGHQYALFAGLSQSTGDAVITMDADLQHPPDIIPKLVDEWRKGNKIVHTIRLDPENISLVKKSASKLFYKIFSLLSGVPLESGMADFRLLDRQVVDSVLQLREEGLFLRGIVQWVGYSNSTVSFQCQDRFSGTSKYTLKKMVKFAFDGITSFSLIPLRISIYIGVITSLVAFGEMSYAILIRIFTDTAVPGWASAVGILSFLFGILFILLGVIGDYIGRILVEVRSRPRYLISEQVGIEVVKEDFIKCAVRDHT
jgi:dolichol-phosphate mannosyltransferase